MSTMTKVYVTTSLVHALNINRITSECQMDFWTEYARCCLYQECCGILMNKMFCFQGLIRIS